MPSTHRQFELFVTERGLLSRLLPLSDVSLPSSKTPFLRQYNSVKANFSSPLHRTKTCNSELSHSRAFLSLYHNKGLLPLNQKESHLWNLHCLLNCLLNCMSGWYLALHRHWHLNDSIVKDDTLRDTLLGMIWTTSTTTFHNLWYGGFVNLPHGLLRNPFLRDHFDTSHNLLLDLRDCHVHNSFNGALLITLLWDQSHNFTDLLHDLRNVHLRLAVWTQHRRSSFLRTSVNSFPDSSTYCTSTRRTCTTAFAVKTVKLQQAARNCIRSTCFGIVCTCLVDLRLSSLRYTTLAVRAHDASTCCARITPLSPPPRVTRGDLQELQSPSQRTRSHVSNPVTAKNLSSTFVTTSSYAFMACLSLASFWVLLLIDSLSITSFLCASLGPGAFSLAHCGSCLVDHGRLDAFTASFTVASPQRSSALFSRVLAETREYASCARCESSVHHRLSLKAVSPFIKSKTIHAVYPSASGLAVSED